MTKTSNRATPTENRTTPSSLVPYTLTFVMPTAADSGPHAPRGVSLQSINMSLADYQTAAARTANSALTPDDQLLDAAAGLAEEAGEVLALVRKHRFQHRPLDRDELIAELGDALWCLATLSTSLGVTLDDVADRNIEKLRARHPDGLRTPGRASL